jgi:hypothetical protein
MRGVCTSWREDGGWGIKQGCEKIHYHTLAAPIIVFKVISSSKMKINSHHGDRQAKYL